MGVAELKEALSNCFINFDQLVLVTNLLDEYNVPYKEVESVLVKYISEQESDGEKYDKRFLVCGKDEKCNSEMYTIVRGEAKRKDTLEKLTNAQSSLYSIQISGGAHAPSHVFQPIRNFAIKLKNVEFREDFPKTDGSDLEEVAKVIESKPNSKELVVEPSTSAASVSENVEKITPELKKPSPEGNKVKAQKKTTSKGINSFFAPSNSAKSSENGTKVITPAKPSVPKGMREFFNKQIEKPEKVCTKNNANISVQLFDDDEKSEEQGKSESSDEEEKLEALRKDIISSDHEEEAVASVSAASKRRRIRDSDEEPDEPQQKHEKTEPSLKATESKSETYLDEDGFVITIKPKGSNKKTTKSESKPKSPPKAASTKATKLQPPAKTKQGNIMNFFIKK